VLHGENSNCKTTIERAADWSQQGLFSLQTSNTITGLENYGLLAAKPRPNVSEGRLKRVQELLVWWKQPSLDDNRAGCVQSLQIFIFFEGIQHHNRAGKLQYTSDQERPTASNTAATLPVLICAITPGIRCATMNSPNPLNSKPKMPSQTSLLDTFVMQLHPLIRTCLAESPSTHDKSASYRQQVHTLIIPNYFQRFGPEKPAWQPDAKKLGCCAKPIGKEKRQHFHSGATL